jgi:hypothetical protein
MSAERRSRKCKRERLDFSAYTTFADLVAEFGVDDIAKTWDSRKFANAMKHVPRRTEDEAICTIIIKRIRNRESARRSREKRQVDLANMETQLEAALNQVADLKAELSDLRTNGRRLTEENARLWKANGTIKLENERLLALAQITREELAGRSLPRPIEDSDVGSSHAESPMTISSSVESEHCECPEAEPAAPLGTMSNWLDVVLNTQNVGH